MRTFYAYELHIDNDCMMCTYTRVCFELYLGRFLVSVVVFVFVFHIHFIFPSLPFTVYLFPFLTRKRNAKAYREKKKIKYKTMSSKETEE